MTTRSGLSGTWLCIALLVAGCSSPSGPTDQAPTGASAPAPEPAAAQPVAPAPQPETPTEVAAPPPEVHATTPTPVQESKVVTPSPRPAPSATSSTQAKSPAAAPVVPPATGPAPAKSSLAAAPAAAPAPAPAPVATPDIVDPGGTVAVAATKPGLKRIGSDACGECHEVQHGSWAKGPHAARTPPLDCESCHGAGSEYKTMSVMKDTAKARAAGLVTPDKAFCSQCHKKGVNDDLMSRAHAHEE